MAGSRKKKKRSWLERRPLADRHAAQVDSGRVISATDKTFRELVMRSPDPVLVTFFTEDCSICRRVMPALEELAGQYSGLARLVKVNANRCPKTVRLHEIRNIPTTMAFKAGELMQTIIGASSKGELYKLIAWMMRE